MAAASHLGRCKPALAATREAVELYRTLAANNPDTFERDLAKSLGGLGVLLSELGHRKPALAASREAVELHRALVVRRPGAFEDD